MMNFILVDYIYFSYNLQEFQPIANTHDLYKICKKFVEPYYWSLHAMPWYYLLNLWIEIHSTIISFEKFA